METIQTVEELKNENLELKLSAIRKDVSNLKVDLHRHLDMIVEKISEVNDKVSITNGSVARISQRINILERQDNKTKLENLRCEFEQYRRDTAFWHIISRNKWVAGLVVFTLYVFSIKELRDILLSIFKII
jgi:hypothetical protein